MGWVDGLSENVWFIWSVIRVGGWKKGLLDWGRMIHVWYKVQCFKNV